MKLLYDRVQIKEVGFPPSPATRIGLTNTWSFADMLREHTRLRLGVIQHIGVECTDVKPGMFVIYNISHARKLDLNTKDEFVIRELDLGGEYLGVTLTKNGIEMSEIKFRPLGDRILIKRDAEKAPTKGKLIVPETANDKPVHGVIVAVGPGSSDNTKMTVVEGDRVMFGKHAGVEIDLEQGKFLLMREADVYGIL